MMNLFKNNLLKVNSLIQKSLLRILYLSACTYLALSTVIVANATDSYQPDSVKLATKATQSKDLYVEPDFNFQTFSSYTLELNVNDLDGQPAEGAILRIYSTDDENAQSEDGLASERSLLGIVRTDHYGSVYQTFEISHSVKQVLIELNNKSPDNQVLIKLEGQEYISHVFAVD